MDIGPTTTSEFVCEECGRPWPIVQNHQCQGCGNRTWRPTYTPPNPTYYTGAAMQHNVTNVHLGGADVRFNHTLHLILTIISCGLWAPVWFIAWAMRR